MFHCFPKLFIMVTGALILLNIFFFSRLIKYTQRLRCFLSMSIFVFKNVFLSRDLFMISLFIVFFMKWVWFLRKYRYFIGACFMSCFEKIKLKVVIFRGHSKYPVLNRGFLTSKLWVTSYELLVIVRVTSYF